MDVYKAHLSSSFIFLSLPAIPLNMWAMTPVVEPGMLSNQSKRMRNIRKRELTLQRPRDLEVKNKRI